LQHDYHISYLIISVFRLNKMHSNSHLWTKYKPIIS
jgi:hypothetical protein